MDVSAAPADGSFAAATGGTTGSAVAIARDALTRVSQRTALADQPGSVGTVVWLRRSSCRSARCADERAASGISPCALNNSARRARVDRVYTHRSVTLLALRAARAS